ncbi:hypothetical protein [Sphingobium sp. WCS2017Hpa-17]|uniref:hypothetical protein n=1 Tax=Sphingobium sp. WCS2017Hpa-17 TaxID=3073638 RepID=UPI00288BE01C|nr:hypothetical protein [Sphingobium sp. WCS2017Hpa-17]
MKTKESIEISHPILVDRQVISSIEHVLSEIRSHQEDVIAAQNNLSVEDIRSLTPADFEAESVSEDRKWAMRKAFEEIKRYSSPKATLKYEGGRSFELSEFQGVCDIAEIEPGFVKNIELAIGEWGNTYASVKFDNGSETCSINIHGDRSLVENISGRIRPLIKAAVPAYPFLHTKWFGRVLSAAAAISFVLIYARILMKYKPVMSDDAFSGLASIIGIVAGLGVAASFPVVKYARRAFPFCQFDFGFSKKSRSARAALIIGIFTVIMIPLIMTFSISK